jgi:hypothetical protein
MTLLAIAHLQYHPDFTDRCRSAFTTQAVAVMDDTVPPYGTDAEKALAQALLSDSAAQISTFIRTLSAEPGFADKADTGDGTMDPSQITDDEITAAVGKQWPRVAGLFYGGGGESPPAVEEDTVVSAVNPNTGARNTAVAVTITGTGLTDTTDVNIGGACTAVTVVDSHTVTATTIANPSKGNYPVVVTVDGTDHTGPMFNVN